MNQFLNWMDMWAWMAMELEKMGAGNAEIVRLPDYTHQFLATYFEPYTAESFSDPADIAPTSGGFRREYLTLVEWTFRGELTRRGYSIFVAYFKQGNKVYWSLGSNYYFDYYLGWRKFGD